MASAYVLINTDLGKEDDVLKGIKDDPSVKEAYFVYGEYDIIAKVETNDIPSLKQAVTKVRRLDYVRSTMTMIVMEEKHSFSFSSNVFLDIFRRL